MEGAPCAPLGERVERIENKVRTARPTLTIRLSLNNLLTALPYKIAAVSFIPLNAGSIHHVGAAIHHEVGLNCWC
jgi:hypothetical protein